MCYAYLKLRINVIWIFLLGNEMSLEKRFKERYKTGDTPWDIGKSDFNLTEIVEKKPIKSCKALDIGCGTGDNSVWLAQKHFQVTGNRKGKRKSFKKRC